jgi:hypothetical protein
MVIRLHADTAVQHHQIRIIVVLAEPISDHERVHHAISFVVMLSSLQTAVREDFHDSMGCVQSGKSPAPSSDRLLYPAG